MKNGRDPCKYEVAELLEELLRTVAFDVCIVNGFRKAGLYPWDADAVAYEKCKYSKETNPWLEDEEVEVEGEGGAAEGNDDENPADGDILAPVSKTFLEIFEDNIPHNVLTKFQNSVKEGSLM